MVSADNKRLSERRRLNESIRSAVNGLLRFDRVPRRNQILHWRPLVELAKQDGTDSDNSRVKTLRRMIGVAAERWQLSFLRRAVVPASNWWIFCIMRKAAGDSIYVPPRLLRFHRRAATRAIADLIWDGWETPSAEQVSDSLIAPRSVNLVRPSSGELEVIQELIRGATSSFELEDYDRSVPALESLADRLASSGVTQFREGRELQAHTEYRLGYAKMIKGYLGGERGAIASYRRAFIVSQRLIVAASKAGKAQEFANVVADVSHHLGTAYRMWAERTGHLAHLGEALNHSLATSRLYAPRDPEGNAWRQVLAQHDILLTLMRQPREDLRSLLSLANDNTDAAEKISSISLYALGLEVQGRLLLELGKNQTAREPLREAMVLDQQSPLRRVIILKTLARTYHGARGPDSDSLYEQAAAICIDHGLDDQLQELVSLLKQAGRSHTQILQLTGVGIL